MKKIILFRQAAVKEPRATEDVSESVSAVSAAKATTLENGSAENTERNQAKVAEQAKEHFSCDICDFWSNWVNGLDIHMSKKQANIEQLDESTSINKESEDNDNNLRTIHYLQEGKLCRNCIPIQFGRY